MGNLSKALLVAVFWLLLLVRLGLETSPIFPVDDAYISFRYAQSWAAGEGLTFNSGERVEGYSNFLFVALLAAASRLGLTPALAARCVNLVSLLLITALILCRHPRPRPPLAVRGAAALLLILSTFTAANALSGLASPLMAAFLMVAVIAREERRPALACAALLLLSLTRPEGIVLALTVYLADFVRSPAGSSTKSELRWLTVFFVAYAAYTVWRVGYFGDLLPNSIRAKSGLSLGEMFRASLPYCSRFVTLHWPAFLVVAAGYAHVHTWKKATSWSAPVALAALLGLCLVIGVGDPYHLFRRYLFPALPLLLLLLCRAARNVLDAARRFGPVSHGLAAAVLVVLFALQGWQATRPVGLARPAAAPSAGVFTRAVDGFAEIFSQDRASHAFDPVFKGAAQHNMARWLQENADPTALLATGEIGIVSYYSGIRVLDTFGLVDRHIARQPGRPGAKQISDYVFAAAPDYFIVAAGEPCRGAPMGILADPRLRHGYELTAMFSQWGQWRLLFAKRPPTAGNQPESLPRREAASLPAERLSHHQEHVQRSAMSLQRADEATVEAMRECLDQW